MASGGEAAIPGTYAPSAAQVNVNQQEAGGAAPRPTCGSSQQDGNPACAQNGAADLAAAFSSFVANTPDGFESDNPPQGMLPNMQVAGMFGLLPQQQQQGVGNDSSNLSLQKDETAGRRDAVGQQPTNLNTEPDAERPDGTGHDADLHQHHPSVAGHPHPHQLPLMHMGGHPRPAGLQPRWVPPAIHPAHWDYGAPPPGMPSHQQPSMPLPDTHPASSTLPPSQGQAAQPGQPNGATGPASAPASTTTSTAGAPPSQPGSQMPVHHPGAPPPLRGAAAYPYGPYGEPCPYPPHARPPPPGPYHHPGMPGPPHMVPYHPGYPLMPHHPHMSHHRAPYYPHDTRYPPMAPMGHPGYPPPPPGYYRAHPGMPPPPHPSYHYMPPPYGAPHPGMHPGMYHPQAVPGMVGPGGQGPMDPSHPRDGTASAASAGTAVCGGGGGSDGGTDPTSASVMAVRQVAGKVVGSSGGGSESEDVGLEAVITLRPGMQQDQEHGSGEGATANAGEAGGDEGCVDTTTGRPMCHDGQAQAVGHNDGPMSDCGAVGSGGGGMPPPGAHMHHKMAPPPPQWSYMVPPPPHGMPGPMPPPGVAGYDWLPTPPVMHGYSPVHPQGSWMYTFDPMTGPMHHPSPLLGEEVGGEEDADELDLHHSGNRRHLSQSSLGGAAPMGGMFANKQPRYPQSLPMPGLPMPYATARAPSCGGGGAGSISLSGLDSQQQSPDPAGQTGATVGSIQRSGSLGQLFSALGDGSQSFVSRRTQRLKKRRSADAVPPGSTPDPFALAIAATERAAAGRDSSTGSGAPMGLPPMFPLCSGGGARRSSNGSDRTLIHGRGPYPPGNRQRSDPGYLIEGPADQGVSWAQGAGPMVGPMAGLGQLMVYPQHLHHQQQLPHHHQSLQVHQAQQHQHVLLSDVQPLVGGGMPPQRRVSENRSSGGGGAPGGGRAINLPKRFEDAIMTLEYPKAPQPVAYPPQRKAGRGAAAAVHVNQGLYDMYGNHGMCGAVPLPDYPPDDPPYEVEEDEGEAHEAEAADRGDDSDEDYDAAEGRRGGFRGGYNRGVGGGVGGGSVGGAEGGAVGRKRKMPMTREEPPQPEKKRKARDPATISKVVLNCVIILRMVSHDLVYEKEIRNALGNNPDTSKALRLLMNQGKLVRTGQGGRGNPFCYRCTPLGIATLQRIEDAATPGADPAAGPNPEQRAASVAV